MKTRTEEGRTGKDSPSRREDRSAEMTDKPLLQTPVERQSSATPGVVWNEKERRKRRKEDAQQREEKNRQRKIERPKRERSSVGIQHFDCTYTRGNMAGTCLSE